MIFFICECYILKFIGNTCSERGRFRIGRPGNGVWARGQRAMGMMASVPHTGLSLCFNC